MNDVELQIKEKLDKLIWTTIPDEFVVFDTETTGLDPKKDRILEIGAVLFKKDDYIITGEVSTFQCFIKQSQPIPKDATAINKITDEMVIDGNSEFEALDLFFEFVGPRDLYAYNSKFDKDFIDQTSIRCGYSKSPILGDVYDVYKFVRESYEIKPNYRLGTVAKHFGLDSKGAHRAVKDSVLALGCFIQVHQRIYASENYGRIRAEAINEAHIPSPIKNENPPSKDERVEIKSIHLKYISLLFFIFAVLGYFFGT
jgi:DNA polymerase-3 subunit epsilon